MENKKDFVFEKPKLPLWFMKSCLDYLLVQPKLNLSELTSELKGKLDKEERMEAISWFERNGLIETTDEKKRGYESPKKSIWPFAVNFTLLRILFLNLLNKWICPICF